MRLICINIEIMVLSNHLKVFFSHFYDAKVILADCKIVQMCNKNYYYKRYQGLQKAHVLEFAPCYIN